MEDFLLQLYLRDLNHDSKAIPAEDLPGASEAFDASARERLVLSHLQNVIRIAFSYRGRGVPVTDLINEGNIGLMRAAELFDPERKVRFGHYAGSWIRTQMDRALSYQSWPVSLPADFNWRRGQVCGAEERLTATLNRAPDDAEVANDCGLAAAAVRRLRATPAPFFVPLDSSWPDAEPGLTLGEVIPDDTLEAPDGLAARRSDREFVNQLVATLGANEKRVIELRYGLDGSGSRTLIEVGRALGYGRQGVHRIESAALAKLKQHAHFMQLVPAPLPPVSVLNLHVPKRQSRRNSSPMRRLAA